MGGGGGGPEDFLEKNNQDSDKDKQNRQDDQANKKNIQDGVKKRRARKCQKTNGHKLTYMIYKHWRGVSQYNLTHKVQIILSADTEVL